MLRFVVRQIICCVLLACAGLAHAGFFVRAADLPKLKKIKGLDVKSIHAYRHVDWAYIDLDPKAVTKFATLAAGEEIEIYPESVARLALTPSDPLVANQVHLIAAYSSGDIHAIGAWDILTTSTVKVAVIDSGVEFTHEDLAANIWNNDAEINGSAGVDDDGNGYIDDFHGWNTFANNNDVQDTLGHGTRVVGVVGARGQNGVGGAGVCWGVEVVPVRAFELTTTTTPALVAAFDYAMSIEGVRVINCSFGEDESRPQIQDAITRAASKGILVVAAAGNNSRNIDMSPFYPASHDLPNVIAVGAVSQDGNLWSGSNFGNTVKVVAPGTNIYSTAIGNTYNYGNGTSYATPIVSGAAALLMTEFPYMPIAQVKRQIQMTTRITNPLLSEQLGGGLLDMEAMFLQSVSAARSWQAYE